MLKQTTANFYPYQFGEAALAASRQVWLASLGAAVVTRDWVQSEAGGVFKTLVKEGTVVESRAIRFFGDRIESSLTRANSVWKQTRRTRRIDGEAGGRHGCRLRATGPAEVAAEVELPKMLAQARQARRTREACDEGGQDAHDARSRKGRSVR